MINRVGNSTQQDLADELANQSFLCEGAEEIPEAFAALEWELTTSRQQIKSARLEIEKLAQANLQLEQKKAELEQELTVARHWGYHDQLTGLPNRSLLIDRLNQAIVHAERQAKQVVLLLLDLDSFKSINDTLGHAAGDQLLVQVAHRLTACIRASDTACRYGGDEFVIMVPEFDRGRSVRALAKKIRARVAEPFPIDGLGVRVSASIGIALYPEDAQNCSDLIKKADIAMYRTKAPVNGLSTIQSTSR
jgi:diguanylate cyclase